MKHVYLKCINYKITSQFNPTKLFFFPDKMSGVEKV